MTASDTPAPDSRQRPRPRVAMTGQLVHGVHRECADVVIRNITDGGAKVRLTATRGVVFTSPLTLRLASGDRNCAVAWQREDEVGLRFL